MQCIKFIILKDIGGKLYKGLTNNIERRLYEHRVSHTITTAKMKEFKLIYSESFETLKEARKR